MTPKRIFIDKDGFPVGVTTVICRYFFVEARATEAMKEVQRLSEESQAELAELAAKELGYVGLSWIRSAPVKEC